MQQATATRFKGKRPSQGDVLAGIEWVKSFSISGGDVAIDTIMFPRSIVLSQDCDLENLGILSVLLAPLYVAEQFFEGSHLSLIDIKPLQIPDSRSYRNAIRNNEIHRYHYLEFSTGLLLPKLIVDFKHFVSVSFETTYDAWNNRYLCSICTPFRECISHRFSAYLSRTGTPLYCRALQ